VKPSERVGSHEAVLQARYGKLEHELLVEWETLAVADEQSDDGWEPPAECIGPVGCGCATGAPASGAWAVLLLIGLLARRQGS
jgi:uncharacterized protein (TIGR03382 family)